MELSNEELLLVQKIGAIFKYDALILLDCVLTDDTQNPEFSAKTVYDRLEKARLLENIIYSEKKESLSLWLISNGYSKDDICLLERKVELENNRYPI